MPSNKKHDEWSRESEKITRSRSPKITAAAKGVYLKDLTPDEQMDLTEEIVETRGAELCRAYENVVDISAGYKTKRNARTGKTRIVQTPCVVFVVKRKWRAARRTDEALPTHLFAYWKVGRERKLCAVPTDVEPASKFAKVKPQAKRARVSATYKSEGNALGAVTCAIRAGENNLIYALSCRHVFSITESLHDRRITGARVHLNSKDGEVFGRTTGIRGRLSRQPAPSFDAQLASVEHSFLEQLSQAVGDLTYDSVAETYNEVPDDFWIHVPGRETKVAARKLHRLNDRLIDYTGVGLVRHRNLIEVQVFPSTRGGDSGSPASSLKSGGMLIGMHIAGLNDRAYLIPAWDLFTPKNYGRSNEQWRLVNIQ